MLNSFEYLEPSGRAMSGWIPIYDTMHGIRGEVNLLVKVELFSDLNKFRQSSCGVKFFFSKLYLIILHYITSSQSSLIKVGLLKNTNQTINS